MNKDIIDSISQAINENSLEYIKKKLIEYPNINLNSISKNGEPFLNHAISLQHFSIIQFLIESGANVNSVGKFNNNSLLYALANIRDNTEIIKYLIYKGANINHANEYGNTALILVTSYPQPNTIELLDLLINADANVNIQNIKSDTALSYAIYNKDLNSIRILLNSQKIDLSFKNENKLSYLEIAQKTNNFDTHQLLQSYYSYTELTSALGKSQQIENSKKIKL